MNLLIVSHDITEAKKHLMPWRTVCEVSSHLQGMGHQATLLSLGNHRHLLEITSFPGNTIEIRKQKQWLAADLQKLVDEIQPDVIFWPVSWRDPVWRSKAVAATGIPVVGWFPGSCYRKSSTLYAMRRIGLRNALPYLIDAFSIRKRQIGVWRQAGFTRMLTMTNSTAECVAKSGWPVGAVAAIPPGKENNETEVSSVEVPEDFKQWLDNRPFYLFMGPPSAIRGVFELLAAFEITAESNMDICLVCLFRSDGVLDRKKIKKVISNLRCRSRIFTCWESLQPDALNGYMESCHAAVMPFVVVPSEIPLAVIEAARWGKPVITTGPSGTGEYVSQFGLAPAVGNVEALADAMKQLATDVPLYNEKGAAASRIYGEHPTWAQVAQQWANVAETALSE